MVTSTKKVRIASLIAEQVILPTVCPSDALHLRKIVRTGLALGLKAFMLNHRPPKSLVLLRELRGIYPEGDLVLLMNNVPSDDWVGHYVEAGADGIITTRRPDNITNTACNGALYVPTVSQPDTFRDGLEIGDMLRFITGAGLGINCLRSMVCSHRAIPGQNNTKRPAIIVTGDQSLTPEALEPYLRIPEVTAISQVVDSQLVTAANFDLIGRRLQRAQEVVREVRGRSQ